MRINEEKITVPAPRDAGKPLEHLRSVLSEVVLPEQYVVRLMVTQNTGSRWELEIGTIAPEGYAIDSRWRSIFNYRRRGLDNAMHCNVALVLPTGIGAELGGHSGDAGPLARLFGMAADCVITHPNVVNGADINDLPENGLYVEGSILSRLLMGEIGLRHVRSNRLLTIVDNHPETELVEHSINSVGAARATMGLRSTAVARLPKSLEMKSLYSESGRAGGEIAGLENLLSLADEYEGEYDAVAITSRIQVPKSYHHEYYLGGLVNPWGGVEAMLTHTVSTLTGLPSAHSPMMESEDILNLNLGVVDPRMAAEVVSVTYLNCVLRGLQRAPQVIWDQSYLCARGTLWAEDISALVIPKGCIGLPTLAALEQGIPVIEVQGNTNLMENRLEELPFGSDNLIQVDNYIEAAGVVSALRSGISLDSLRRPMERTRVEPALIAQTAEEFGDIVRFKAL